jgi:hypothetical protein
MPLFLRDNNEEMFLLGFAMLNYNILVVASKQGMIDQISQHSDTLANLHIVCSSLAKR